MNLIERLERDRTSLQYRLQGLLKDGSACLVKEGETVVTSFYLDSFEILIAQPFFDRVTGELENITWWCCLREIHFEEAMQRSHLMHVTKFDWIDERNLLAETDDFIHIISALDPKEIDPEGNAIWREWRGFKRENPWLEDVSAETKNEYLATARRSIG